MTHREVLVRMRGWIEAQMHKATLPGQDPFDFTSLAYCASQVGAGAAQQEVIAILQAAAKKEPPYRPLDAMRSHRAIFLINRAITVT